MFSITTTTIKAAPIQMYNFVVVLSSFQTSIFNRFIVLPRCYAHPCALGCYSNGYINKIKKIDIDNAMVVIVFIVFPLL